MNKIKKIITSIGGIISILLMFSPIIICAYYKQIGKYWWLLLILSVCYDAYVYSLIRHD